MKVVVLHRMEQRNGHGIHGRTWKKQMHGTLIMRHKPSLQENISCAMDFGVRATWKRLIIFPCSSVDSVAIIEYAWQTHDVVERLRKSQ
jgi:hypothetical protein